MDNLFSRYKDMPIGDIFTEIKSIKEQGNTELLSNILRDYLLYEKSVKYFSVIDIVSKALGEIGSEDNLDILKDIASLKSEYSMESIEAIGKIGGQQALDCLVEIYYSDNFFHYSSREYIAEAMGKIGGQRAAEELINIMIASDGKLYKKAAKGLAPIADAAGFNKLIEALDHDVFEYCIVDALVRKNNKKAIGYLEPYLISDKYMRVHVAAAIGKLGDSSYSKVVRGEYDDFFGLKAISKEQMKKWIKKRRYYLIEYSENVYYRKLFLALALTEIDTKAGGDQLILFLGDDNPEIRKIAADELTKIQNIKWNEIVNGTDKDFEMLAKNEELVTFETIRQIFNSSSDEAKVELAHGILKFGSETAVKKVKRAREADIIIEGEYCILKENAEPERYYNIRKDPFDY
ncbi:MAG: HEAT repeat domain-containing protein [Clostridia bacterium]|nr:HEAT repeat domain-containing protein [Clostridia bacterium]